MAACAGIDPEVASLFGETSDEESFHGFGECDLDSDSDKDLDQFQPEEDEPSYNTEDEDEEVQWQRSWLKFAFQGSTQKLE